MEKMFYTIGEVAEIFNENTSLIRFWEKEFDIINPSRNKKGNRLFTKADLDNFYRIHHLVKDKGFTLQGAKDELKKKGKLGDGDANLEIIKSLKKIKDYLLDLKNNLE